MGSHGRSGFERLFLGIGHGEGDAEGAMPGDDRAEARAGRAPDQPVQFRRILCPMDFSDGSLFALELAL